MIAMKKIAWRFLVLAVLMFWQGGFTFYASVVVPIGQSTLASHFKQGLITRRVTDYLNLSGGIALAVLAGDAFYRRDPSPLRRRVRWASWVGMAILLAMLVWLHPRLDELLDLERGGFHDRSSFRSGHRWYLWLSTFQWGLAIVYGLAMLGSWQAEDGRADPRD